MIYCYVQVASELNSSLLRAAHIHPVHPKLAGVLKMLLWAQDELDKKGIRYNKVIDLNEKARSAKHWTNLVIFSICVLTMDYVGEYDVLSVYLIIFGN